MTSNSSQKRKSGTARRNTQPEVLRLKCLTPCTCPCPWWPKVNCWSPCHWETHHQTSWDVQIQACRSPDVIYSQVSLPIKPWKAARKFKVIFVEQNIEHREIRSCFLWRRQGNGFQDQVMSSKEDLPVYCVCCMPILYCQIEAIFSWLQRVRHPGF